MLIFLIGYMGSGKTTLGRELASRSGYPFIDTDDLVVKKLGMTVDKIFRENGEDIFRAAEHDVLISLTEQKDAVIATGGGTPCFFDNMDRMNEAGITVYLKVSVDVLHERLKMDAERRPLLKDAAPGELKGFIEKHLEEREPFYLQARISFDPTESGIDKLMRRI